MQTSELEEPMEASPRELAVRLLMAQDEERRRIARELHDGTAPSLVALMLDLNRLAIGLSGGARALADSCIALCEQTLGELRSMTFLLHPPILERHGLPDAIRWLSEGFARRTGIEMRVDVSRAPPGRLGAEVELALYRVAQEALTNIHRHSTGRKAEVTLSGNGREIRLTVSDDGALPRRRSPGSGGVGIESMRERLRGLGGRLELIAGPLGTVLVAAIPRSILSAALTAPRAGSGRHTGRDPRSS